MCSKPNSAQALTRRCDRGGGDACVCVEWWRERGAKEIFALHILDVEPESVEQKLIKGVAGVLTHRVGTLLRLQAEHDLLLAEVKSRVKLHYIPLTIIARPAPTDFSMAQAMIDDGYQITQAHFESVKGRRNITHGEAHTPHWITDRLSRIIPRKNLPQTMTVEVNAKAK